jgi:hypothetical protein
MTLSGKALRQKGYLPLPVEKNRKGCVMPGWPDAEWGGEAPGIGLNLVGLVMIDIDIDIPIDQFSGETDFVMELTGMFPPAAPYRLRHNSSRVALLMRCPELVEQKYFKRTSKWKQGHVEVKGGRGKFLFGWGKHPSGAQLHWEVGQGSTQPKPENFPKPTNLPIMGRAELDTLIDTFEARLSERFGEPIQGPNGSGWSRGGFTHDFDITEDMVFGSEYHGDMSLEALRDLVRDPNQPKNYTFVNLTPWRPDSDSMAGLARWSTHYDCLCVTDFVEGVVHYEKSSYADEDIDVDFTIEPLTPPAHAQAESAAELQAREERMARARSMLFVETENAYVWAHDPQAAKMSRGALFTDQKPGDRAEMLRAIPYVNRQIWDPTESPLTVIENELMGWREHNLFYIPERAAGGEIRTFIHWLERFIPDPEERAYVFNWMAAKAQYPHERCFAVAMIGAQGSGKGTLWRLIQKLWGSINVAMPGTMEQAFRGTYQDYLYRRLYCLFDEVTYDDAGTDAGSRRKAANVLKSVVDTTSGAMQRLNVKYERQKDAVVSATMGVATNHIDALPLEKNDRRFLVVKTGPKLDYNPIPNWAENSRNLGTLMHVLREHDISKFDFRTPAMTEAKAAMFEVTQSELDEHVTELRNLAESSGGYITRKQFDWYCEAQGIHHKKRTVAYQEFKRAFPHTRVCRHSSHGTFRVRYTDTAHDMLSGPEVVDSVNKLSSDMAAQWPTFETPPSIAKP